jgi:hypothetical protein
MAGMVDVIRMCVAGILGGKGLAALAVGFAGWLYWLRFREKREQDSPERRRERLRQQYWGQL